MSIPIRLKWLLFKLWMRSPTSNFHHTNDWCDAITNSPSCHLIRLIDRMMRWFRENSHYYITDDIWLATRVLAMSLLVNAPVRCSSHHLQISSVKFVTKKRNLTSLNYPALMIVDRLSPNAIVNIHPPSAIACDGRRVIFTMSLMWAERGDKRNIYEFLRKY